MRPLVFILGLLLLIGTAHAEPSSPWPAVTTLPTGERIRITRVDAADVVYDLLGAAPEGDAPETVTAPAQGVPSSPSLDKTSVAAVVTHIAEKLAAPPPVVVPATVTRRQLKEWLIAHDLIESVDAALAAIPDAKAKRIALNWWTESQEFHRDHPLLKALGAQLTPPLTAAQIDAAFIAAAKL